MPHPRLIDVGTISVYLTLEQVECILSAFYDWKAEYGNLSEQEKDIVSYLERKKETIERNLKNGH